MTSRHRGLTLLAGLLLCVVASSASAQPYAYVLGQRDDPAPGNSGQSVVSVINTATNSIVQSIPVGMSCVCVNPDSVVINRDGSRVYVANEVANSVSVIDTATNTVIGTINVGAWLSSIALSPDGQTLFVVAQPAQVSVYVFSTMTGALEATIPLGVVQARGSTVTPDGAFLYVSTYGSNSVKVIDTASLTVIGTVAVGSLAVGLDVTPNGSHVYVANFTSSSVSVVSTATNTVVATIPVGLNPNSARVSPDGSRVYVTNSSGSSVTVINTQTNTVTGAAIAVQSNPRTVEFTADGARAYVANSQNVQVINTSTLAVAPTIAFNSTTNGTPAAMAVSPATIVGATMTRDKSWLRFGAVKSGAAFVSQTSAQSVRLTQIGAGTVTWTATPTQPWIQVTPSTGTGTATLSVSVVATGSLPATGTVNAAIRLTFAGATPGVAQIPVSLLLMQNGTSTAPFGTVDTPADNAGGVTGAVPFTGWALDDIEVAQVAVCRSAFGSEVAPVDPNCGSAAQIFLGFGVFIAGARPDVQSIFPNRPGSGRAGWGFMVLTNMLPSQGNGTYVFHMWARDREGQSFLLGTRRITCSNASATKPFGAIDTPEQGGIANGASYVNFGWALTPFPKTIPTDGSTISVLVDGAAVGTATYNNPRADIQALFPGLNNTNGAVGFRILDTTSLANGTHTVVWVVSDDQGSVEGIGSRFFTVSNGTSALTTAALLAEDSSLRVGARATVVTGRRGWNLTAPPEVFEPDATGRVVVLSEEVNRVELQLEPGAKGFLRTGAGLAPLPIGSQLDAVTGVFTWAPGVGFVGPYDFTFIGLDGVTRDVRIVLAPKGSGRVGPQVVIDTPRSQQDVAQPFVLGGWAADLGAAQGTGIATLHAWAYPLTGGPPVFLGATAYGGARPDVAAVHGDQFEASGFGLVVQGLSPGHYDLAVFAWSTELADFVPAKVVRGTVR